MAGMQRNNAGSGDHDDEAASLDST